MRICILGTGPIGRGAAALLEAAGHTPVLWSPRQPVLGQSIAIETFGLVEHRGEVSAAHGDAGLRALLSGADAVMLCLQAAGFRRVIDQLIAALPRPIPVIVSSDLSLAGLYLAEHMPADAAAPVISWSTTLTGGPFRDGRVHVRLRRGAIDMAAIPGTPEAGAMALDLCQRLFGDRFSLVTHPLAITLSNLNPPIHMANCLLNLTRIEQAETWPNFGNITEAVGRMIDALDVERLAVAAAFGLAPRSARQHYRKSFPNMPENASVHEMAQIVDAQRQGSSPGPATLATRYITEDLPFGIVPVIALGRLAGVPTPLHEAGLTVFDAALGTDHGAANDLLNALGLAQTTPDQLIARMLGNSL